jgi:hypothetical protein
MFFSRARIYFLEQLALLFFIFFFENFNPLTLGVCFFFLNKNSESKFIPPKKLIELKDAKIRNMTLQFSTRNCGKKKIKNKSANCSRK